MGGGIYLFVCLLLFHVCECFTCTVRVCTMSISGTHGSPYLVPMEAHIWYPWKVTDSRLVAIWWVLGTELGYSAKEASAFGFQATSDCI